MKSVALFLIIGLVIYEGHALKCFLCDERVEKCAFLPTLGQVKQTQCFDRPGLTTLCYNRQVVLDSESGKDNYIQTGCYWSTTPLSDEVIKQVCEPDDGQGKSIQCHACENDLCNEPRRIL